MSFPRHEKVIANMDLQYIELLSLGLQGLELSTNCHGWSRSSLGPNLSF